MGTHPIFESDFDCLTEKMSIAGSWKKVKVDNGLKFGKAIGATDEQLAKQAQATSTVNYEITGNHVKVTRVHTIAGNDLKTVNEAEIETQGKKIKVKVGGTPDSLTLDAVSGWAKASVKVVDGQLVGSMTHAESGETLTTYWARA